MSSPVRQTDEQIGEELILAYRASIEDPPFSATDYALLHAAADSVTRRGRQRPAYAAVGGWAAAAGLVIFVALSPLKMRTDRRPYQPIAARGYALKDPKLQPTQSGRAGNAPPDEQSLIDAMFGASYARAYQLEEASVALQFAADSQGATLAMRIETTNPDLHDLYDQTMALADRALRD